MQYICMCSMIYLKYYSQKIDIIPRIILKSINRSHNIIKFRD